MKTVDYIEYAKERTGLASDNKLAIRLGWNRQKISNYRNLPQQMDNEAARQMAELIDVPVMKIIADMEAIRQKDKLVKKAWDKLSKQAGNINAKLLLILPFISFLCMYTIYYVKSSITGELA